MLAGGVAALQPELELFRAAAGARGLDLAGEPQLVELGYSAYLLASLVDGWPTTLAVLYGAEKAYVDAWTAVRARASTDSPYWSFIDSRSSPAFGQWVDRIAALVDDICEADRPAAHRAFRRVVRFERALWDAVHAPGAN